MKKSFVWMLALLFSVLFFGAYAFADAVTMSIADTCDVAVNQLEVEVMGHGYASVSEGRSVTIDAPEGTKASVIQRMQMGKYGPIQQSLFGPWTPIKAGGVLAVQCMPKAECSQQRLSYCYDNNLSAGHDADQYCHQWAGCNEPMNGGDGF